MRTQLDCIPCLIRQALDAARLTSRDPALHEGILRDMLRWTSGMDLSQPPPLMGQRIHRRLRALTGLEDPYRHAKEEQNRLGALLLAEAGAGAAGDPLERALRLAVAGNVIDLGVSGSLTESDVRAALGQALAQPLTGDLREFRRQADRARTILYLADNAGEIVFDRVLVAALAPARVVVAVRGGPVLNDATLADARAARMHEVAEVVDNGSDAPGTLLSDCSAAFRRLYAQADLVVAKGQGNFETLSRERKNICFLFKAKCPVIAEHAGVPLGAHVLWRARSRPGREA
ncbi:MAG TPA: ARMT1-like domain-containing protein [Candidatus Aminicenantes bacterium]|nr:ARMT1-like domain-containing protein [Candidatus Aminicenantes bacterium]